MMENLFSENITLGLLFVATGMFVWLAIKSKNIKSFQFQVSVFVMIWIAGELVDILQEHGMINSGIDGIGMQIHLVSMVFLSCILWLRYYSSKRSNKKMVEELEDYDN